MTQTPLYLDVDVAQECLKMAQMAQQKIRDCDVIAGKQLYERVINKDLIRLFFDSNAQKCHLSSSGIGLPLDKLAIYLTEMMFMHMSLPKWRQIVYMVLAHNDFIDLSINDKCLLHATYIYSQQMAGIHDMSLENRAFVLNHFLEDTALTGISRAIVAMVLGTVYRQLRDKKLSLKWLHHAEQLLDTDEQPFYSILVQEAIGSTTYFINDGIKDNYLEASTIYEQTEELAHKYTNGYDFAHQAYNLGWVYAEIQELDTAMYHFERGLQSAIEHNARFEQSQYEYGIGYVYLVREVFDKARDSLLESLDYFMTMSHVYSVACLNLLALVDKHTDVDLAINWIMNAKDNLERIDHPTQSSHVDDTLKELYDLRDGQDEDTDNDNDSNDDEEDTDDEE